MKISLLVAMSENRVIGREQKLPWHLPEDLKRFKKLTLGHPIIMGRKTFESIGKALPGRENVVVTRSPKFSAEGVRTALSLEEALKPYASKSEEVFVIGGGDIFSQAIALADSIRLTLVHANVNGDVYFPIVDWTAFEEVFREDHSKPISFSFIDYKKRTPVT